MSDLKVDGVIASTGTNTNLTLQGKGSGKVAIGDGALLFPDADGSANQVIETNASGVLSFVTPSAGGGAMNFVGTVIATDDATIGVSGMDSAYDHYVIIGSDLLPASDGVIAQFRLGDSSGIDDGAGDYSYRLFATRTNDDTEVVTRSMGDAEILISVGASFNLLGNATGEGINFRIDLKQPGDATKEPSLYGHYDAIDQETVLHGGWFFARREAVISTTQVQFSFNTGNVTSGRMTVWGVAHA